MSNKTRTTLIVLLLLVCIMGIGIMAYPIVSTRYMERVSSEVHTQYTDRIAIQDTDHLDQIRASAQAYNQRLFTGGLSLLTPEENGYYQEMIIPDVTDTMGYITIPRLNVSLPIYHGVGNDSLSRGCGHMPQSSLPIGGPNTHAVLSAHTGMAKSKMFTDLPMLQPGDTFELEVLGDTLTYEIQTNADIQTVLPSDIQAISIRSGEDLCTLVTCVPFGVNTHRLLVTGHRIPTPNDPAPDGASIRPASEIPKESVWEVEYRKSVIQGILIISIIILAPILLQFIIRKIKTMRNKKHRK